MDGPASEPAVAGPLTGLRVLELGHFIAAPFCTRLLADLGADVIKVEPPGGDPIRQWGKHVEGAGAPWWSMHGRNKRVVTINLKTPRGVALVLKIAGTCDAVVENFRPGQLAQMGLGREALEAARPGVVLAQISGYGQNGIYRDRAAFGVIGEAVGGLRYLSNHPPELSDLPPVRVGVSIGDSIAGLYGAFGIMSALWARDRPGGDGRGRALDVALTEAVLSMMEGTLPEYSVFGDVRQPVGSRIATASPSSAYPSADGMWILIAGNSDPIFGRLTTLMGQPELARDPRFLGNQQRVKNVAELDALIGAWSVNYTAAALDRMLADADVPATLAYTAADIAADPQFRFRGMVREVEDPALGRILHAGIVPKFEGDGDAVRWCGPQVGQHTDEILRDLAGLGAAEIERLRADRIVA